MLVLQKETIVYNRYGSDSLQRKTGANRHPFCFALPDLVGLEAAFKKHRSAVFLAAGERQKRPRA